MKTKELLFFTGTRADFGKVAPLARYAASEGFSIKYFVTGMHMMKKYGLTKLEVHGETYAEITEFLNQRPDDAQDIVLCKTAMGLSDYLAENKPDLVVIHGDRIEALAAAIVCATNNIRSAHIEGGEVSGTIDEALRHATSKLSTHHFVSSQKSFNRLIRMGEDSSQVYNIGSPELDVHVQNNGISLSEVKQYYDIAFDEYGICLFHPVTTEHTSMKQQAECVFKALVNSHKNFVVILPNNDPGSEFIDQCIDTLPTSRFRCIPSMRFLYFSKLLQNAACIVGNSSAGVREAPFFGVPSIDVGNRQKNRSDAPSIINVSAMELAGDTSLIFEVWNNRYPKCTDFGEGNASKKFAQIISTQQFWDWPLQKVFNEIDKGSER